jgi:hypothetical protein
MTKSQLIRRIEELEAQMVASRGFEFIITNDPVEDDERKIIVVFRY